MNPEKLARVTIEDAQQALERRHALEASGRDPGPDAILVVGALLDRLLVMGEPHAVIATDGDGFIVEGALQCGFDMIDDNGSLLVVHQNDLIEYIKRVTDFSRVAAKRYQVVRRNARMFVGMQDNTPEQFDNMVDSLDTVELPPHAQVPE